MKSNKAGRIIDLTLNQINKKYDGFNADEKKTLVDSVTGFFDSGGGSGSGSGGGGSDEKDGDSKLNSLFRYLKETSTSTTSSQNRILEEGISLVQKRINSQFRDIERTARRKSSNELDEYETADEDDEEDENDNVKNKVESNKNEIVKPPPSNANITYGFTVPTQNDLAVDQIDSRKTNKKTKHTITMPPPTDDDDDEDCNDDGFDQDKRKTIGWIQPPPLPPMICPPDGPLPPSPGHQHQVDIAQYVQKKSLAQGMMDLALVSANTNQLRYVLDVRNTHPYFYVSLGLIISSLILQVIVGLALIWNSRYNMKKRNEVEAADKVNNISVIGVFFITMINVFISTFGGSSHSSGEEIPADDDGQPLMEDVT